MNRSPTVMTTFRAEATEKLAAIDDVILSLEVPTSTELSGDGNGSLGQIQIAFRHAHGLKGAAGLLGIPKLVNVLHGMETVFGKMRDEGLQVTPRVVDILLQATEAARLLVADADYLSESRISEIEKTLNLAAALASQPICPVGQEGLTATNPLGSRLHRDGEGGCRCHQVLIVDDSPSSRRMIREAAFIAGWEVGGEVPGGQDAIQSFREIRPQLVTLDLVMPVLRGLDTLSELKRIDAAAAIVVVSVLDQREVYREAFRRGASDFLVKPVNPQRLAAMFHRVDVGDSATV